MPANQSSSSFDRSVQSPPPQKRPARRRGTTCKRCRTQKIRCDDRLPDCSACVRANATCERIATQLDAASKQYIRTLENRLRQYEAHEGAPQPPAPPAPPTRRSDTRSSVAAQPSAQPPLQPILSGDERSADPLVFHDESPHTYIESSQQQPLAHDVGLLSLGNSSGSKYLGPSSGVTFARLIYAAAPQTQGLSSVQAGAHGLYQAVSDGNDTTQTQGGTLHGPILPLEYLPHSDEARYFLNAYFETWHPFYPFIQEHILQEVAAQQVNGNGRRSISYASIAPSLEMAQYLLVMALGARILESRLATDFESSRLLAAGAQMAGSLRLHDSFAGIQSYLLLVLCGLAFPEGLNAWFLMPVIIASCLDLGIQRRNLFDFGSTMSSDERQRRLRNEDVRSSIFWSAYSLERTLSVVLGRPLTLRDEAIDIRFPGGHSSDEIDRDALDGELHCRAEPGHSSVYTTAVHSFRFDRIVAEIKLMIYRVAKSPVRFPWPTDLEAWQRRVRVTCSEVLANAHQALRQGGERRADATMQQLTLKYHQCVLLLSRPSPALPEPSSESVRVCYQSASESIRIYGEMTRFGLLADSWLTAHAVFVSGITVLYCVWSSPQLRSEVSPDELSQFTASCIAVLKKLSKTWSVAARACDKYTRLVDVTQENWRYASANVTRNVRRNASPQPLLVNSTVEASSSSLPAVYATDNMDFDFTAPTSTIIDELGDMSSWFDLDWLGDFNAPPSLFDASLT